MSEKRKMKKIDMETLEQVESKVSVGRLKKMLITLALMVVLSGGGFAAYRLVAGEVIAARYAVPAMYCPACVTTVQEVTGKIPGVIGTDVSLASQTVIVKFRSKRTTAESIRTAIERKGYPIKLDGMFEPDGGTTGDAVVAQVNGKPLLARDIKTGSPAEQAKDPAEAFYSAVGREILLQAADSRTVVVSPSEIDEVVEARRKKDGISKEEMLKRAVKEYGSVEKYRQVIARDISIRKLLDDYVLMDVPKGEQSHKALEWVGSLFKVADVKISDPSLKKKLKASAGRDEWKTFWPVMIGRKTELGTLITPPADKDRRTAAKLSTD